MGPKSCRVPARYLKHLFREQLRGRAAEIAREVGAVAGVPPHHIMGREGYNECVDARSVVFRRLAQDHNATASDLAEVFGFHAATVCYHLGRCRSKKPPRAINNDTRV